MKKDKIKMLADKMEKIYTLSYLQHTNQKMSELIKHFWEIEKGGLDGNVKNELAISQTEAEEVANELYDRHFIEDEEETIEEFHIQTLRDILRLIDICQDEVDEKVVPTEKFDEIRQYTMKLKRYIEANEV